MATSSLREELSCSICLSLYKEPVSLKCGHNFCRDCIGTALDTQKSAIYSCPECREQYTERPPLEKNRKLCNIVDNFRSAHPEDTEVFCTYCNTSVPATKSCLLCEASFCDMHLRNHSKSVDHILSDPTTSFDDRKCSIHKEILKYYCTEANACICMSCWVAGDHKGHQVELLNEASEKKKEKLKDVTEKLTNERQETEKRIQNLENHRTGEKRKANYVPGRVTELFRDIRRHLDDEEKKVLTEVSRQEEKISQSVCDMIQKLETQKEELSRKINEMEAVCDITDPLTVLKKDIISDDIIPRSGDVRDAGCLDEGMISEMLHRGLLHFTDSLKDMKIKIQFTMMEKSDILLDIKTANNRIIISQDLKSATFTNKPENRLDVPERFTSRQVISTKSFSSGRHYWEVDVSGAKKWLVGVANHSIERKIDGNESYIGYNDKSWGLTQRDTLFTKHNNSGITIVSKSSLKTVGICLDYDEGRLSFYQLCDPIRHLHTFTTTFTEPLHAAFFVFKDSTIRII
ncbi:E3 ubiquitin-protein ligase TRIM39-like [Rana temporaria]|uniref:E3 ubiquitin-protein ligase TRIM39-like n=1 Tax=Rana temporaria TaxID=8407 RepID=UPI001AADFDBD|nr:E3 ubiquitin-protein ligase TRIM39-like [Rana temporaria]